MPMQPYPTPLPSTTLLFTQITNLRDGWKNSTRCRDGAKVFHCHSRLVWLVFEGYMCLLFFQELFCDLTIYNIARLAKKHCISGLHLSFKWRETMPLKNPKQFPLVLGSLLLLQTRATTVVTKTHGQSYLYRKYKFVSYRFRKLVIFINKITS